MNPRGAKRPYQALRQIPLDSPGRQQPPRKCKATPGRSVSSLAPTSSSNIPPTPGQAAAESKRLAVRLTTLTGCDGLGLFARQPSSGHNRLVFRRGETIMNVEDSLAFRQTQENGKSLS